MTFAELTNLLGFKIKEGDVQKVNQTFADIKNNATKILGAIGIGFSLSAVNGLIEEFGKVKQQIKNSTNGLGDQEQIQKKILAAAADTRTSYSETAKIVSNLVHENSELFGSVDEAIKFNNAATMLFKTAGKTNEDIAGLMEAINKSFAKGYVDSETLSQLLERSPEAVELLNKKLGTTSDQLEQMASDGKFTIKDLKDAFVDSAAEIEDGFTNVKMTVTEALTVIRNKWGLWLSDTDETFQITQKISRAMVSGFDAIMRALTRVRNGVVWLSEKLGGLQNLYRLVGIVAGSVFGYVALGKLLAFIAGIKSLDKALLLAKIRMVAIVAAIILIALLVEDFFQFMKGNNSLIGSILEKSGVDCDALREKIRTTWNKIKSIISKTADKLKEIAGAIGTAISDAFKIGSDIVGGFIDVVKDSISWMKEHETALGLVAIAFGTLTAAIIAYNIQQKIKAAGGIVELAQLAATAIGVGALTAAETAHTIATGIATAAMTAYTAAVAFLTSPITLVILAIGALIAIIYLLVKNWDTVKEAASKCWDWIKGIWSSVASWFKSAVIDPIVGFFTGLWNGIIGIFQGIIDWVANNWQSIVLFIINPFAGIFNYLYENFEGFRNFIDGIVNGVKTTVGNIKDSIVEGFNNAIEWIKSLPAQALTWGADIIQGIVSGIKGAIGKVGEAVSEVAGKIRSFLGFSEPEDGPLSNFHTYMPDMIDLMSKGIKGGKSKIKDALNELTGDMALMANVGAVSPGTAGSITKSSVSKSIVQHVSINNKFEGDRAGQQKSAVAMKKAAGDVTAELARGLAFTR